VKSGLGLPTPFSLITCRAPYLSKAKPYGTEPTRSPRSPARVRARISPCSYCAAPSIKIRMKASADESPFLSSFTRRDIAVGYRHTLAHGAPAAEAYRAPGRAEFTWRARCLAESKEVAFMRAGRNVIWLAALSLAPAGCRPEASVAAPPEVGGDSGRVSTSDTGSSATAMGQGPCSTDGDC
jgi:hypothetical protein